MANSARIDELEKKFSENARRYFAPLANEYRKAGDLDRAIEICRAHLPQQPGHMSGHVVYGQALYESRQLDEAKTVFESALALDPENLIALRHLGDIARDSADPTTARIWYLRVLDADPRNDEVAGMLAELDAAGAGAASAVAPPAPGSEAVGWGDINPERTPPESSAALPQANNKAGDAPVPNDAGADSSSGTSPRAARDGAGEESVARGQTPDTIDVPELEPESAPADQGSGEAAFEEAAEPVASPDAARAADNQAAPPPPSLDRMLNDAFASEADTLEIEPFAPERTPAPASASKRASESLQADLDEQTFAEVDALFDEISPPRATGDQRAVTGAQPTQPAPVPRAARSLDTGDALFGDDAGEPAEPGPGIPGLETAEFVSPSRQPAAGAGRRESGSMAVTGLTSFDQPTDEDSSTRAAFVTETMAELYLQQGFTAEALDIYRQLVAENPDDASLRDRVDQLERGGRTSLSVAAVSSEVIEAAKQRHATRAVRTVRSFFGRLAGRRAPHDASRAQEENGSDVERSGQEAGVSEPESVDAETGTPPDVRLDIVGGLFGGAPVSQADEQAASTLASAFSSSVLGVPERAAAAPARPPTGGSGQGGRAAHAGGSELSLDQVFREPAPRNPRKSGAYSFDQFFSDGTPGGGGHQPGDQAAAESSDGPEGDLEQFTAWLEGLKRK